MHAELYYTLNSFKSGDVSLISLPQISGSIIPSFLHTKLYQVLVYSFAKNLKEFSSSMGY